MSMHTVSTIEIIKKEAKLLRRKNNKNKSHKHYLNIIARKHGYKNYDHIRKIINERQAKKARDKGEKICLERHFDEDRDYYLITILHDNSISYASNLGGWDKRGNEQRIIAKVKPDIIIELYRNELKEPLLVIHDFMEPLLWMEYWKGKALIDCNVSPFKRFEEPQLHTPLLE